MSIAFNPDTFSSLHSKNFRLFLLGQSVSLIGLWMQRLAGTWLVYRLTDSAFKIGINELVSQAPIFVVGLLAGAYLDTHDIKKTLIITQFLALIHAIIMAFLIMSGTIEFWHIIILSFYLGVVNAVDLPARQSSIILMVENRFQLKSALSLHSVLFNLSRFIGPTVAGFVIYYSSEATCFIINAMTYVPVIYVLFKLEFKKNAVAVKKQNVFQGTIEGFKYVASNFALRTILIFLSIFAMFSYSYSVIFPIFAKEILGGGSQLLGFLIGGIGCGAIFGALALAAVVRSNQLHYAIGFTSVIYIIFITLFSFSTNEYLSILLTIPAGLGLVATFVATNTLLQTISDDTKRSRVVSLYTICSVGLGPIGAFLAGASSEVIGAKYTFLACAAIMLIGSIFLWLNMKKLNEDVCKQC